jgi:pilus assembly protein CpaF
MNELELIRALGPLAGLYQDDGIQEIIVDGPNRVYFEREQEFEDSQVDFETAAALTKLIEAVMGLAGVVLTPEIPSADIRLPDNSRFLAALPPTAVNGPYLVIRKPFLGKKLTWENLLEFGSVDQYIIDLIQGALDAGVNILDIGGTASGKTTLLNMILGRVPAGKRIVAVEDVHYLNVDHPRAVYLESQASGVSMQALIETASRMRPDWLVINELRGPEALTALQMFNSGYSGMASMHAEGIADGLSRLETMCLSANLGLGLTDIRRMIASAFQLVLYLERVPSGKRRVTEMAELGGLENQRYILQPLARYNRENDRFEQVEATPTWSK